MLMLTSCLRPASLLMTEEAAHVTPDSGGGFSALTGRQNLRQRDYSSIPPTPNTHTRLLPPPLHNATRVGAPTSFHQSIDRLPLEPR